MKKTIVSLLVIAFAIGFVSCNDSEEKKDEKIENKKDKTVEDEISDEDMLAGKLELFILNDFFPTDIFKVLNEAGKHYNSVFMNPVSNLEKYNSSNEKAFALGVYGADLNYSICFDKASDALTYLSTSKKIAEEINVPMAFDEELIKAYQDNLDKKDQLTLIIIDAYDEASEMLKSNEQLEMSTLVIAGGWFEGLYLAVNSYDEGSEELNSFLLQQASKLQSIIEIMNLFTAESFITSVKVHFEEIADFFNQNKEFNKDVVENLKKILENARNSII